MLELWMLWNQRLEHACDVPVSMDMLPKFTIVLAIPACKHWQLAVRPLSRRVCLLF